MQQINQYQHVLPVPLNSLIKGNTVANISANPPFSPSFLFFCFFSRCKGAGFELCCVNLLMQSDHQKMQCTHKNNGHESTLFS